MPKRALDKWVLAAVVALVCSSTAFYVVRREQYLKDYARASAAAMARFAELKEPGARIAFWERDAGATLGEATFRFWGNWRWYRQDGYDDVTLARFPEFTFIPLRTIGRPDPKGASVPGARHLLRTKRAWPKRLAVTLLKRTLGKWYPRRDTSNYMRVKGRRELFTGEGKGIKVCAVVYKLRAERSDLHIPRFKLLKILEQHLGPVRCSEEDLGGVRWVIIKVKPRSSSPAH